MKNNFDLRKFLIENKLTINSKMVKEDVNYRIKLLVPTIYFNVKTGEMSTDPYEFGTEDEIQSGEADITKYSDGEELDMVVFGGDYDQAKRFEAEYPDLFKVVTK